MSDWQRPNTTNKRKPCTRWSKSGGFNSTPTSLNSFLLPGIFFGSKPFARTKLAQTCTLPCSLGPRDLQPTDTSGQIKRVILRIRMDKKKKRGGKGEDVRPNFVSRRSYIWLAHNLQPSLRVWVSVNSGYEPTECSSGSSSCRRGSRNWRSSLVKILTLGGKLGAVASRKELQLNSQEKR